MDTTTTSQAYDVMEKWATTLMQYFSAIGIVLVLYDYLLVELAQRVSRRKNHKDLLPPRKLRPMYIVSGKGHMCRTNKQNSQIKRKTYEGAGQLPD